MPAVGDTGHEPNPSPGSASGRERGGDKRERILQAATRIFARKGYYAARVRDVAQEAGVADGTIYLYFRNKEDLLLTLFRERAQTLLAALRAIAEQQEDPTERMRQVIALHLGIAREQRELAQVMTVTLRQSASLIHHYGRPLFREYLRLLAEFVEDGQRRGQFRAEPSPRVVARALWGAMDGLALTWSLSEAGPEALSEAAVQLATLLLQGLVATPAASG